MIRCATCGATNAADARWCGQCLTRFGEGTRSSDAPMSGAVPPPAAAPPAGALPLEPAIGVVARGPGSAAWTCPACGEENPLERAMCGTCGTPMTRLLATPKRAVARTGATATALSVVLPGAGHAWAGRAGDAVARIVLFVWSAGVAALLLTRDSAQGAVFRAIGAVFAAAALAVWGVALAESRRLARGDATPIVSGRTLMWATAALTTILFLGLAVGAQTR